MSVLSTEVVKPDHSARTDQGLADHLAAKTLPGPVSPKLVIKTFIFLKKWAGIKDGYLNGATPEEREACIDMVDALSTFDDFDLQDPVVRPRVVDALDALIAVGKLTVADRATILLLDIHEDSMLSWAEINGVRPPKASEIHSIRQVAANAQ